MFYKLGFVLAKLFGKKIYWVEMPNSKEYNYLCCTSKQLAILRSQQQLIEQRFNTLSPIHWIVDHYGPITKRIYREDRDYLPEELTK